MTRIMAEYHSAAELVRAAQAMRKLGYSALEAYSPYPVHGIDEALGRKASRLPWLVFLVGVGAAAGAYSLEWLLNAYLYPLNVGNRPPHYPLSYVPITFEMGVLFAAFCAFALVFILARLPTLHHPVFEAEGFESASCDRFWLEVSSTDARFRPQLTEVELAATEAVRIVAVEEAS